MTIETLEEVVKCVFFSGRLSAQLDIAWHSGEPLAVPLDWYERAFATIEKHKPPTLSICHRFQTNGLLLTDAWIHFLQKSNAVIGISLDGPVAFHDRHRRRRNGLGTHQDVMRAIAMLQKNNIEYHVITVLTEYSLKEPDTLFDFYIQSGIREVGFNIDEIEGLNKKSSMSNPDAEASFRHFISAFFERVWRSPHKLILREFESALEALKSEGPIFDEQNVPFAIVSVDHSGSMSTFSPELLGASHPRFKDFVMAKAGIDAFEHMQASHTFKTISSEILAGVRVCKKVCPYFRWCAGGAPANKLFETGRFDVTETLYCRLMRQAVLEEAVNVVEKYTGDFPCFH